MNKQKFNDQEIVNCMLISLKHLKAMYNYFSEEAGTPELFQEANRLYEEVTTLQREIYDYMIEENWMQIEAQTASKIEKAYKPLKKKAAEIE